MTYDEEFFKEHDRSAASQVKIGNGNYIAIKRKETVAIESCSSTKIIINVFYIPDINQNLLNVGQLLKKGFKVIFEDKMYLIKDADGRDMFRVKIKSKSFSLDLMEEEQVAYPSSVNTAKLWHTRLGHFNHATLLYMKKKELV